MPHDAVDPQAGSTGTPTTRGSGSSSVLPVGSQEPLIAELGKFCDRWLDTFNKHGSSGEQAWRIISELQSILTTRSHETEPEKEQTIMRDDGQCAEANKLPRSTTR